MNDLPRDYPLATRARSFATPRERNWFAAQALAKQCKTVPSWRRVAAMRPEDQ